MEKNTEFFGGEKFNSPEEELAFLREKVAIKEKELFGGNEKSHESLIRDTVEKYKQTSSEDVLNENFIATRTESEALALGLKPEEHDSKMSELLSVLRERGIKNALTVLDKLNNPHLSDDFEKFLVQYIKAGFPSSGLREKEPLAKSLRMTLFEISLPEAKKSENHKTLKELIGAMEQFYAGMLSVSDNKSLGPNYFTIELAVANHSDEFVFHACVPDGKKELFEKQILSVFSEAKISEKKDDYNIFNESGAVVGSYAKLSNKPAFPIRTYEEFDHDPLNAILRSFSKIDKDGEGASIQIIYNPVGDKYNKMYEGALEKIIKGVPVKEALDIPESFFEHLFSFGKEIGKTLSGNDKKSEEKKGDEIPPKVDDTTIESIRKKIKSQILNVNIRMLASSRTEKEAEDILADMESAFNQFDNPHKGNKFRFERFSGKKASQLVRDFTFRLFSKKQSVPLSVKELTTVMHFPGETVSSMPELKISKAGSSPAPLGLPENGVLIGVNKNQSFSTKIFMSKEDRLRHVYSIGQTGTGKTTLLKNMAIQDIRNGDGVCVIDPHGSDIEDILALIPKDRYEDLIYFDPSYTERPMALNMLEYDERYPEQKTFVVNELFNIFKKLYGHVPESMGPAFEQYFRNATLLVLEDKESGSTLLDVSRVLADSSYRNLKLSKCKNPIVKQFWVDIASKAQGESALANIVPYITNKFDVFTANDIMRPIISQQKSSFNFREIMDSKKILLVNLSKGKIGDINSHLIGLILVGKILMAALSRVDAPDRASLPPFYLYIDEFQNITTDSIATILSEARKYHLSLHLAHQFIAQLDDSIKNAVFGNVGSIVSFRVGAEDSEYLEKQFAPVFSARDLMNLDNHNAYVKMLSFGKPVKPFNIETIPPERGNRENIPRLKELSHLKYSRSRDVIEEEIKSKYQKPAL